MYHYLLCISYNGASFHGWQRLSGQTDTIQGIIETTLSELLNETILIRGSGRTDAKVNALHQYADFFCNTAIDASTFSDSLNQKLPVDIRILSIQPVAKDFHCRKSCTSKTYLYCISLDRKPDVFARKHLFSIDDLMLPDAVLDHFTQMDGTIHLNEEAMDHAARCLTGTHDYSAFTTDKTPGKSHVRHITEISMTKKTLESGKTILLLSFTGDGFLYNMVRILAGTLIMAGLDQLSYKAIPGIIKAGKRESAGPTLPAHALFLSDVCYDSLD